MEEKGIFDFLKELETKMYEGFPVFSSYAVVNKKEIFEIIDQIYASIPTEVAEARAILRKQKNLDNE